MILAALIRKGGLRLHAERTTPMAPVVSVPEQRPQAARGAPEYCRPVSEVSKIAGIAGIAGDFNLPLRDPSVSEWFEERAAILEFDAGLTRMDAESEAYRLTLRRFPQVGVDWLSRDFADDFEGQ